jgi:hypothetical protein
MKRRDMGGRHWISKIVRGKQLAPGAFWKLIEGLGMELEIAAQAKRRARPAATASALCAPPPR